MRILILKELQRERTILKKVSDCCLPLLPVTIVGNMVCVRGTMVNVASSPTQGSGGSTMISAQGRAAPGKKP